MPSVFTVRCCRVQLQTYVLFTSSSSDHDTFDAICSHISVAEVFLCDGSFSSGGHTYIYCFCRDMWLLVVEGAATTPAVIACTADVCYFLLTENVGAKTIIKQWPDVLLASCTQSQSSSGHRSTRTKKPPTFRRSQKKFKIITDGSTRNHSRFVAAPSTTNHMSTSAERWW